MNYKPHTPYLTPMWFATPKTVTKKGVEQKTYGEKKPFKCRFRSFGGTEKTTNGLLTVEDTATVETWYRPDIKADCRVYDRHGKEYEILGTPENIEEANIILLFKIRALKGGA